MKKIAFFKSSYGVGGAERQFDLLVKNIDRAHFQVYVIQISHESDRPDNTDYPAATLAAFNMRNRFDIDCVVRIANYVKTNGIDLIQSQLFMDNQIARAVGVLTGRPVISSVRGGPTLGWWRTRIEHGFQWMSNRVVVNSKWLKNLLVSEGVSPNKIVVIYNGLDPERFHCDASKTSIRKKYGIPVDAQIVGIVARLHPMKDHRSFFDAISIARQSFPNLTAAVVGDGVLRDQLKRYVAELGISESVRFFGTVGDALPELLRIMDVFLFTSRWGESLPNALLEAMAAGIPIVATRMHGVPEIVTDRENGFLVDCGDSQLMAKRLAALLSDGHLRQEFVDNGTQAIERFTIARMVNEYEQLYGSLI